MSQENYKHELRRHFCRQGLYSWMVNLVLGASLMMISPVPAQLPWVYAFSLVTLGGMSALVAWLSRVQDEWNPDTYWIWDYAYVTAQMTHFFISAGLASWVIAREGVGSLSFGVAVFMCVHALEQSLHLFFPRLRFLLGSFALIAIPVCWAFYYQPKLSSQATFGSLSMIVFYMACLFVRSSAKVHEYREFLYLKAKISGEKDMMQKFLDIIPAKVSWLDSQFRYKMINRGLLQYLGVIPKSLLGSEFGFTQNPEFKILNRKLKEFRESQLAESSFEHPVKIRNQVRRHHVILKKIESFEGVEIVMMTIDIEDLKKAQEILQETGSNHEPDSPEVKNKKAA